MPSSDTQFKPGQSGNPNGRPKLTDKQKGLMREGRELLLAVYLKYSSCSYKDLEKLQGSDALSVGEDLAVGCILESKDDYKLRVFVVKQLLATLNFT